MKRFLSLFVCLFILLGMPSLTSLAAERADNTAVTLEYVMNILDEYDADGAFIMRYAVDQGEDVMVWWNGSGDLLSALETAVHEECHGYSFFNRTYWRGDAIYTGNKSCIQVPHTDVYQSTEMARTIPANLRTFRYDTYIGNNAGNTSANVDGIYGMLNEFTAYCWGFHNVVSLYPYYQSFGTDRDIWEYFAGTGANGRMAYAEFKYYMLMYLAYAKENYPAVYEGIMGNKEFLDAYFTVEAKYVKLIAEYEKKLQETADYLTRNGYRARIDGDTFWIHNSGCGIFTSEYRKLMAEIDGPVCREMNRALLRAADRSDASGSQEFVTRLYRVCLGREPDEDGLNNWTEELAKGALTGQDVANGFIMSDEFQNKGLDNSAYVDAMYAAFFGREADPEGKKNWVSLLEAGSSRRYVMAGFANSEEFDNLCGEYGIVRGTMDVSGEKVIQPGVRGFVERCYTKVLGRAGEKAGVEDWTNRIATGRMSAEDVAKSFFFSEEYINKHTDNETFVETLYQTFMDRASDPAGKADWVGRLNAGADREAVLEGFSRSEEFGTILRKYGL